MKTNKLEKSNAKKSDTNFDVESSIKVLKDELLSFVAGGNGSGGSEIPDPIHNDSTTIK